jgi:hypothetical protein
MVVAMAALAWAHGLDAHRVQIEVDERTVRVAATPGVGAFPFADTNRDGRLDRGEVAAARDAIRAAYTGAFHLFGVGDEAPVCDPASVSTVGDGGDHV